MCKINIQGSTITGSVIGKGSVYNFNSADFEEASSLIANNSSLDTQTIETLRDLFSKAEEAIKRNDEVQKVVVKEKFSRFWRELGEKTKIVFPIIEHCMTVLTFLGIKP